jgi:hypothetical protein
MRDQMINREIALLSLKLQAVEAGLTRLWEVTLYPLPGVGGPPIWTVVSARNSQQAAAAALQQRAGYVVGPIRALTPRRR